MNMAPVDDLVSALSRGQLGQIVHRGISGVDSRLTVCWGESVEARDRIARAFVDGLERQDWHLVARWPVEIDTEEGTRFATVILSRSP
jgi:hypothetical protein